MELILQSGLEHQQVAVDSIAKVFEDIHIAHPTQYYTNPGVDVGDTLFQNISNVQKNYKLHSSLRTLSKDVSPLHLDIKMETYSQLLFHHIQLFQKLSLI